MLYCHLKTFHEYLSNSSTTAFSDSITEQRVYQDQFFMFTQTNEIDYTETFLPVAKTTLLHMDQELYQLDVKKTFSDGKPEQHEPSRT